MGENIFVFQGKEASAESAVNTWYNESKNFDFNR